MSGATVIEKIVSDCEEAVLNQKPIIILRTNEIEIVRRVVDSDRLVTRLSSRCESGVDDVSVYMTRDLSDAGKTMLFAKASSNIPRRDNFNITYISAKDLQKFSDNLGSADKSYGVPTDMQRDAFPHLYIISYRQNGHNMSSMWDKVDLNPFIDRFLADSLSGTAVGGSVILLYGKNATVAPEYQEYCEIIDEPYPGIDEIKKCIESCGALKENGSDLVYILASNLLGLPLLQVERIIRSLSLKPLSGEQGFIINDERMAKDAIRRYKEQVIKSSELLELVNVDGADPASISPEIGGMQKFSDWVKEQEKSIKNSDRLMQETGAFPPKGVLLCGIPGCGKSMAVERVAKTLNIPLLKLDIGNLMGSYVGESEHNMLNALKIAEAMAPCVLFIDELDKGFSSVKQRSGGDSGTFKRMFGTLLSWMQNCKKTCFIFATANDISGMPKEFFRSGRFDCMYSLYMPTLNECVDIFINQMAAAEDRVRKTQSQRQLFESDCYDKKHLSDMVNGFVKGENKRFVTGADIQKLVNMSLRTIWSGEDSARTISRKVWEKTVAETLEGTSVYGDGKENVDSIAICYIRLLRNNFIPSSDEPMFTKYRAEKKMVKENGSEVADFVIHIDDSLSGLSDYDRELKARLTPLIKEYGAQIERYYLTEMMQ